MRYDKRDRTKLIVLGLIVVGLWVVIGVYAVVLSRHWQDKLSASHRAHAPAATDRPALAQQPMAPQVASRVAALVTPVPPPARDPFQPKISPRTRGAATRPTPPAEEQSSLPLLPPPPQLGPSTASAKDILHVTGIILGNPSTAVLRVGDQHHVVREGYWLDNRVRVQTIGESTVTLRDSQGTYVLRLGQ